MYARIFAAFVLFVILGQSTGVSAAETVEPRSGKTISWTGTIGDDVFSAGQTVDVDGTVQGDAFLSGGEVNVTGSIQDGLYAAGGQVYLQGDVGNDVIGAGGNVETRGYVGDNLILAGGNIRVFSQVDGRVIAAGGSVRLDRAATVSRDAWLSGGLVKLDGDVSGGALLRGGEIVIGGHIAHDVVIHARNVRIESGARIDGNLTIDSPNEAEIADGAVIGGTIRQQDTGQMSRWVGSAVWVGVLAVLIGYLYLFIVGLLMIAICPGFVARNQEILSRQGFVAFGIGALFVLAVPPLIGLLMITVVGIPFAFGALFLYILAFMVSIPLVGTTLARLIASRRTTEVSRGRIILYYVLVLVVFWLIALIPFAGSVFWIIMSMLGLGLMVAQMWPLFGGVRRGVQPR